MKELIAEARIQFIVECPHCGEDNVLRDENQCTGDNNYPLLDALVDRLTNGNDSVDTDVQELEDEYGYRCDSCDKKMIITKIEY